MAEPHTLKVGDRVTHPEWPAGTTRKVLSLRPFQRMSFDGRGRRKLRDDPNVRIAQLDGEVGDDDAWMEAGLEVVDG